MDYVLCSFFFVLFLFSIVISPCYSAPERSADTLLQEARLWPTAHPMTLSAEIRGADEPLFLTLNIGQGEIAYQLHNPEETIVLKLSSSSSSLSDTKKGIKSIMTDEKRYQEIRNTGVSYDDLSLAFLYWPHPHLIGKEQRRGTTASIVQLTPPAGHVTPYGSAKIWIDQHSGAPILMEGFNAQGKSLKRFEVISAQKIKGLWTLKEMRIETVDPETGKIIQRRYLTVKN